MDTDLPPIAMVTPSFNQAPFLEMAIRSVLDQDYPTLEYFVADGGSTDGSVEILKRHDERLAGWVSERDGGQYAAVANGFARTKGEILGWLNSDDALVPGALSIVGEIFAQFPQIDWLTTTRPLFWDARGRAVRCEALAGFSRGGFFGGEHLKKEGCFDAGFIQQESTFWRRSLWEKAGGFDPDFPLAGDFALWARFFEHAELVGIDAPLAGFRLHEDQKTGHRFAEYSREAEAAFAKYGGRRGGFIVREIARRLPAAWWPALARLGWMHRTRCVSRDLRRGVWTIAERFV
ncbi:MAG: glycosyltransferase family 2 protein [Chthoniobacteraceae bacterium]